MREILFKAKRKLDGAWVVGDLSQHKTGKKFIKLCGGSATHSFEVDEKTICQYTGLTDKNGNKIWENDIIKDSDNDVGIINYGMDGRASFVVYYEKKTEYILLGKNNIEMLKIEVIGNTFENADLLKGE